MRRSVVVFLLLVPLILSGQESQGSNGWDRLAYFIGIWKGNEDGGPEQGRGDREYRFILKDQYIHFKNRSVFEPSEKRLDGEVHEDWGFFSYDRIRKKVVLRQFHGEGFVNQYLLDSLSVGGKTLVFETESVENGSPGLRARLEYHLISKDEFEEAFHLGFPGQELKCVIRNHWKRKE